MTTFSRAQMCVQDQSLHDYACMQAAKLAQAGHRDAANTLVFGVARQIKANYYFTGRGWNRYRPADFNGTWLERLSAEPGDPRWIKASPIEPV